MEKKDIRSYTFEELKQEMEHLGEKSFRAKQVYEWLHVKLADSFEEMTNLSKALREKLDAAYEIAPVKCLRDRNQNWTAQINFCFAYRMDMWWKVF